MKHWRYFLNSINLVLQFRAELLVYLVTSIMPVIVLVLIWKSIFDSAETLRGLTYSQVVLYYLLALVIRMVTKSDFENRVVSSIRHGKIDFFFIKPGGLLLDIWWKKVGSDVALLCLLLPALLLAVTVFSSSEVGQISRQPLTLLVFGGLVVFAYAVEFLLSYLVTILGFWFEGAEGLQHFKWILISVLSGMVAPDRYLPESVQWLVSHQPFHYMYSVPIQVILEERAMQWWEWSYPVSFLIFLSLLCRITWHAGVRRYTSTGG